MAMGYSPYPPPRQVPTLEERLRKENASVKDAWEKYQIVLKLVTSGIEADKCKK